MAQHHQATAQYHHQYRPPGAAAAQPQQYPPVAATQQQYPSAATTQQQYPAVVTPQQQYSHAAATHQQYPQAQNQQQKQFPPAPTAPQQIPQTPEAQKQYALYQQQVQAQWAYQQQLYQQQLQAQYQQMQMVQLLQYQNGGQLVTGQLATTTEVDEGDISNIGAPQAGMVTRWIAGKRSGWIQGDNGESVFVYYKDVLGTRQDLKIGERVTYQIGWNAKALKKKAEMVQPLLAEIPEIDTTPNMTGKVTLWNDEKKFGFITHKEGSVFVHNSDLIGVTELKIGQEVEFGITINPVLNKQKAVKVSIITDNSSINNPPESRPPGELAEPAIGPSLRPEHSKRFAPY